MGLDMYLERYPRYKHYGPKEMDAVKAYYEWLSDSRAREYTLKQWCGVSEKKLPRKADREHLKRFICTRYWEWDNKHEFPHDSISEQVAYWRKANAIHKWFVDKVQDGEDDCSFHREVTQDDFEELRDACQKIIEESVLIKGKVKNGYSLTSDGREVPNYEDGYLVANPCVCHDILPCTDGFFFGSKEYNEWYLNDIKYTFETVNKILEETDFETQMIYYISSW